MTSQVEQVKSRLDIVELIQSYIKLQKAGSNLKANCPFHNEKTPSFFVSPSRENWHCFGCGKSGDIISFVQEIEGVEFKEALQMLADRAGVELKNEDPRLHSEKARLLKLLESASIFFASKLNSNSEVLKYLTERGLKLETIRNWRIGYAPESWDAGLNHLKSLGYRESEIEKAGLAVPSSKYSKGRDLGRQSVGLDSSFSQDSGVRYYDRFRSRIMFPISDSSGRIVGFSGRIFDVGKAPAQGWSVLGGKYINTPQTLLYDKSRILYGFDRAKLYIRKENVCVLAEGQMDVVMSHQADIKNVVGASGTALTTYQLAMIKRLSEKLVTAFDMDEAGGLATQRGIDLAIEHGMEVNVAMITSGKDPADLIKKDPELWRSSIQNSRHIIDFYLDMLNMKYKDNIRELRKKAGSLVLPYVAKISSEIDRAHWIGKIASQINLKEEPLWDELRKYKNSKLSTVYSGRGDGKGSSDSFVGEDQQDDITDEFTAKGRKELLEERILGIAVWKKDKLHKIFKKLNYDIFSERMKPIIKAVFDEFSLNNKAKGMVNGLNIHKDYLNNLALKTELLYSNSTDSLKKEVDDLCLDLEREFIKVCLIDLTLNIEQAEKKNDQALLKNLTGQFKDLSKKLL